MMFACGQRYRITRLELDSVSSDLYAQYLRRDYPARANERKFLVTGYLGHGDTLAGINGRLRVVPPRARVEFFLLLYYVGAMT